MSHASKAQRRKHRAWARHGVQTACREAERAWEHGARHTKIVVEGAPSSQCQSPAYHAHTVSDCQCSAYQPLPDNFAYHIFRYHINTRVAFSPLPLTCTWSPATSSLEEGPKGPAAGDACTSSSVCGTARCVVVPAAHLCVSSRRARVSDRWHDAQHSCANP